MTTSDLARSYLSQARIFMREARAAWEEGLHHIAVRRSQETVEMALKALLRGSGIEVPHVHDPGEVIQRHQDRFPESVRAQLDDLAAVSGRLAEDRGPAFYGDEEAGIPAEQLFGAEEGQRAVADAERILSICAKALADALGSGAAC